MSVSLRTTEGHLDPLGYEQLTSLSAAAGLTPPNGARIALIHAESQDVRWRDDGVDPDATTGMTLVAGADFVYTGDFNAIKFIETAASAKVNVSYYK